MRERKEPAEESKMQTHSLSQPKGERETKLEEGKSKTCMQFLLLCNDFINCVLT